MTSPQPARSSHIASTIRRLIQMIGVHSLPLGVAGVALLAAALVGPASSAVAASPNVTLGGVHWYSGDSSMLDMALPFGERGWNVEVIFSVDWCDGNPNTDPGGVRSVATTARDHGLVNIIRVDYRQMVAVPANSSDFAGWANDFIECTSELNDVAQLYIVGNEPNIEGGASAAHYAAAFNYLYSRKGEMPAGTQLLATFNSPFTPPEWMSAMAGALTGVDGFTMHSGGIRPNCQDPRQPCSFGGWNFDGGFRYYRDVIDQIPSKWWGKPVYITEFNTYTGDPGSEPQNNYITNWVNWAFQEVRSYNATRGSRPPVRALAWFVDRPQSWPKWSLRNIPAARTDMAEEFRNPANRPGGPSPTATPAPPGPTPTPPPGQNVARGAAWQASSVFGSGWGGDKATDGVVSASSKWTSSGGSAASWLALDLGQTYQLTGFVVRHAGAAGEAAHFNTQAFRVESGSSFNGPWTTLATVNNAAQTQSVSAGGLNASARFVRLYVSDAGIDNHARIPEFEVYAQQAPTPTPGPAGPLQNGGFEGAVQANGVGASWSPFASGGAGASFVVVSDVVHSGSAAQQVRSQPSANDQFAGVFQTVATTPGAQYTVRAWNRVNLPGGSGWPLVGRLGIDLGGGTNFAAGSVSWVEFDAPENGVGGWVLRERTVTAEGNSMTIFLQSWRKWSGGGASEVWFDDVQVIAADGGPAGENVARGAGWRASSVYGAGWGGDRATDGVVSPSSKWTSSGGSAESWLALDLGQTYQLTGFVVRHAGAAGEAAHYNTQAFRLESGSSLSGPWTTLRTVSNVDQSQEVSTVLVNADARYVRLYISDAGIDNYARIPEFEVYAQGTTSSGSTPTGTAPPGGPMPDFCPPALDFSAIRQQLAQQGREMATVKLGFHAGTAGNHNGLGEWMQCLDAAGVPFFLKSVDSAGVILEAAQLWEASRVPHVLVYRKAGYASDGYQYDVPDTGLSPLDAANEHWRRHVQVFPPELLPYKDVIWLETINEVDKGRAEWYGEFAYHVSRLALRDGFNWSAFGWSSGEPEPAHWRGPWMRQFLQLASEHPDRLAIALHEYSFDDDSLKHGYYEAPALVGRFQWLYEAADELGLSRPTVLITEFGWEATDVPSPSVALDADGDPEQDNLPWAAELYAAHPQVRGAAIWYLGGGFGGIANQTQQLIRPLLEYALQTYFVLP